MNRKMIGEAIYIRVSDRNETWKCADPELEKQIRCFPYIARSVVERQQASLSMPLNDRGISDYFVPGHCRNNRVTGYLSHN